MPTVWIPAEHSELVERLAKRSSRVAGKPIFQTYMHLMVFAAMVGHSLQRKRELPSSGRGPEIYDSAFLNNNLDGVAFLVALQDHKDGEILRETKDQECWRVIEQYAAAGLDEVATWFLENPTDTDGIATLLNKIKEVACDGASNDPILNPGTSVFG